MWNPSQFEALGRLRAEQYIREAEEWRAARLAAQSHSECRGGLARALGWWRSRLPRRRAEPSPLAEPEQL